jgi:Holliday junction resolvase
LINQPINQETIELPSGIESNLLRSLSFSNGFPLYIKTSIEEELREHAKNSIRNLMEKLNLIDRFDVYLNQVSAKNDWAGLDFGRDFWIDRKLLDERFGGFSTWTNIPHGAISIKVEGESYEARPVDFNAMATNKCMYKMLLGELVQSKIDKTILQRIINIKSLHDLTDDLIGDFIENLPDPNALYLASNFLTAANFVDEFRVACMNDSRAIEYIKNHRAACIESMSTACALAEINSIYVSSKNVLIGDSFESHYLSVLIELLKSQASLIKKNIAVFLMGVVKSDYKSENSKNIIDEFVNLLENDLSFIDEVGMDDQLIVFVVMCLHQFLAAIKLSTDEATRYYSDNTNAVFQSVGFDADRAIKKAIQLVGEGYDRLAISILLKTTSDLGSYLKEPRVLELCIKIVTRGNFASTLLERATKIPALSSNLIYHIEAARFYLSKDAVNLAAPHIDAVVSFEPNSKTAEELKKLKIRTSALVALSDEGISLEYINNLQGIDFERLLMVKLRGFGFEVMDTPKSGDFGADIVLQDRDETRYIIQCKRFNSKVNLKAVQEIVGAMRHYGADYAIVATNNQFLKSAVELAKSNDVELWSGDEILQILSGDISFSVLSGASV